MNLLKRFVGKLMAEMSGRGLGRYRIARTLHNIVFRVLAPKYATVARVHGMDMELPNPESDMSRLIALTGGWEPSETRVVEGIVKKGMKAIDCGANAGYYTLLMSKLVGDSGWVYAFEPSPETFRILNRNMRNNRITNASTYNIAVSDEVSSQATFYINKNIPGYDSLADLGTGLSTIVDCHNLDYYFSDQRVDFIKMDIQGAEYLALDGMQGIIKGNPQLQMLLEFAPDWIRMAGGDPDVFWNKLQRDFTIVVVDGQDDVKNVLCRRKP